MNEGTSRTKVWDAPVRLFHWSLALLVALAFLTGEEDDWHTLHVRAGLAVLGLVVFRVAWGFVGSMPARFRSFVRSPRVVFDYARNYIHGRPPAHLSHNPLGAAMVVTMLALLGVIISTGIITQLGPEWEGPLSAYLTHDVAEAVSEVHELSAHALLVLVALHVGGVILSSILERQNLVAGMLTGWKRSVARESIPILSPARRAVTLVASILLGLGVALGVSLLLGSSTAEASESPQSLLDEYSMGSSPDPKAGQALYSQTGVKGESCATCHTNDPHKTGRTPAGKVVQPLAPSANAERLTSRAKADKWFDRNCKQVFGRPCTAQEKRDFVAWLVAL